MARGIQNPVNTKLRGVAGLEGLDAGDEACAGTANGSGEVGASGVEGEVLAPGSALAAGFFVEEELGGGWELVEVSDRDLEILVGVVETGLGEVGASLVIRGGNCVRHGRKSEVLSGLGLSPQLLEREREERASVSRVRRLRSRLFVLLGS